MPLKPSDIQTPLWSVHATTAPVRIPVARENLELLEHVTNMNDRIGRRTEVQDRPDGYREVLVYGHRDVLAFHKRSCPFACRFCALTTKNYLVAEYERAHGPITSDDHFTAFSSAIHRLESDRLTPTTVEILNDGSWYSSDEIPPATRYRILSDLAKRDYVHCVSIESRPEFLDPRRIGDDLNLMRNDQVLQIYVGLETVDDLIASLSGKMFGWDEFVRAAERIHLMEKDARNRVVLTAYNIMKQVLLTEAEAVEQSIELSRQVTSLGRTLGIQTRIKHEPTIVSKGTIQHYLFHSFDSRQQRRYQNLNYFTVAELLARSHMEGMADRLVFGQRDDIDDIEANAMVSDSSDDLRYSDIDFLVYDSVQYFNEHHSFELFIQDLALAVRQSSGVFRSEFTEWENILYGQAGTSSLRQILAGAESSKPASDIDRERERFLLGIVRLIQASTSDRTATLASATNDVQSLAKRLEAIFTKGVSEMSCSFDRITNLIRVDISAEDRSIGGIERSALRGFNVEVVLFFGKTPTHVWLFVPAVEV